MSADAFVLIVAMFSLGYVFNRFKVLPDNAADVLNRVVLYLCFPAAILLHLPSVRMDWHVVGLALTPWLLVPVVFGLLWLANKLFHFRRDAFAALLLCVLLGNTGFVGYPMIEALVGKTQVGLAVVYDQFGNGLILSTFGMLICTRFGGGPSPSVVRIVRRVLFFPPTLALIAALTIMPDFTSMPTGHPFGPIEHALKSLENALLPLVMLAVGLSLRFRMPAEEIRSLSIGLALKLVILPAIVLGGSLLVGMRGDMLAVNVLEAAMPPMITAGVIAIAHKLAPQLAAALVGYGLLASMITLPLWAGLLKWAWPTGILY